MRKIFLNVLLLLVISNVCAVYAYDAAPVCGKGKLENIKGRQPKKPQFANTDAREGSYLPGDAEIFLSPTMKELIDAGFARNGKEKDKDSVRCFQCGIGLSGWKSTDSPWIEHAKYGRFCSLVKAAFSEIDLEVIKKLDEENPDGGITWDQFMLRSNEIAEKNAENNAMKEHGIVSMDVDIEDIEDIEGVEIAK